MMKKKDKQKYLLSLIINIISTIIIIGVLYYIWIWYQDNKKTEDIANYILDNSDISYENVTINDKSDTNINVLNIDFNKLIEVNPDTIGWIQISGTDINYPVVQTNNNDFYLTHSFDKSYNKAGWIFEDCNNSNFKNNELDKNTIIYGHNRENNSMFGTLSNVLKKEWREDVNNTYINFSTVDKQMIWQVFSTYTIKSEDYYIRTEFLSDQEYDKFLNTIKNRSIYNFNVEVSNTDNILTLSTCTNIGEGRTVVHAKLIKNEMVIK